MDTVWGESGTPEARALTSIPCVNDEAAVVEGGSLDQPIAVGSDLAGVAHVRLDDHYCDWTVGDMLSVLQNANPMFANLAGNKGQTWEERAESGRKGRKRSLRRVLF